MLYYTTESWDTLGIQQKDLTLSQRSPQRHLYDRNESHYVVGLNAFETRAEAVIAVKKAGERKLAWTEEQIARIRKYLAELS